MRYKLELLTDNEIKAGSVYDLTNSSIDINQCGKFGTDHHNPKCATCENTKFHCPSHYGTIELSYPYLLPVVSEIGKNIMQIICIHCHKILCPQEELDIIVKREAPEDRIQKIKDYVKRIYDSKKQITCAFCNNINYKLTLYDKSETMHIYSYTFGGSLKFLPPHLLQNIFDNITQIEELGLNENLHPSKFYSKIVVILGNKIRQSNIFQDKGRPLPSTLTNIYASLIRFNNKLKEIYNIYGKEFTTEENVKIFISCYKPVCDLIYVMSLNTKDKKIDKLAFDKTLQNQIDNFQSYIDNFKGKDDTNIFMKGIISSRHNCSARSVLNGAPRAKIGEVMIPHIMKERMSTVFPVYYENIHYITKLIEQEIENNKIVLFVEFDRNNENKGVKRVEPNNAPALAARLSPGCKVHISLIPGDLALVSRYPVVREESISSFMIKPQNSQAISFPLSVTDMKMADFDGDEVQLFINYSRSTEIESLLLNSVYTQLLTHKDGNFAIWYSKDAIYGLKNIPKIRKSEIFDIFPNDLIYKDFDTMIDVKRKHFEGSLINMNLMKYVCNYFGKHVVLEIMDRLINLSYNLNKELGLSFGFEYILPKELKQKLKSLMEQRYKVMQDFEKNNSVNKNWIQRYENSGINQLEALESLMSYLKTTNFNNFNIKKFEIQLFKALICIGQNTTQSGDRFQPTLNNNSRTLCSFPRYWLDPRFYGYSPESYTEGKSAETEFFEQFESRDQAYEKGVGVADQGYLAKKFNNFLGSVYTNNNGAVILNDTISSFTYGCNGLNPRRKNVIELKSLKLSQIEYLKELDLSENDHGVKDILAIRQKILYLYDKYSKLTIFINDVLRYEFNAGFFYNQLIENWPNGKTAAKKEEVLKMISDLFNRLEIAYAPEEYVLRRFIISDLNYLKYYLFEALVKKCSDDHNLYKEIENQFIYSLVDGGEPVGIKASISMSEPLTQASLHAIHGHKSNSVVQEIKRSSGVDRFEELYGEGIPQYHSIILNIRDTNDYNQFINTEETFYYNDIWIEMNIFASIETPKLIKEFYKDIDFDEINKCIYAIESTWDINLIANYEFDIKVLINKIRENFKSILFIAPILIINKLVCYIYFRPDTLLKDIYNFCESAHTEDKDNIITGSILKNCIKVRNVPATANSSEQKFCIEANIINFAHDSKTIIRSILSSVHNLCHNNKIDISQFYTNNIDVENELYGVFEAQPRFYEESIFTASKLSETSGILNCHYKLATEVAFMSGKRLIAKPSHLKRNHNLDPLRKILFERPFEFIKSTLFQNMSYNMDDPDAAQIFNQYSKTGVGISEVLIKNLAH